MLARIRGALGRGPDAAAPEELPPFSPSAAHVEQGDDVGLFREMLVHAGARVREARTAEEAAEYIAGLLPRGAPGKVAVSDGAERTAGGLRASLTHSGLAVVPTLREYEAAGGSPEQYLGELLTAAAGVTGARHAVAATGTLVLDSGDEHSRLISLVPPVHVCLVRPSSILTDLETLCARAAARGEVPAALTLVTGPSRTADIEQTLTVGVHGPGELHVLLYAGGATL